MLLNIKALTIMGAIVVGGSFFLVGLLNLIFPAYGVAFLELGASVYPGYRGPAGFGGLIVVTLYAVVDGAVCGAIVAWLYNFFAKGRPKGESFTA